MDVTRHHSISDSEKLIHTLDESYENETGINWIIVEKHSNSFAGYFGFWRMIPEHCRAESDMLLNLNFGEGGICLKQ
jgi:RimJ/RimL family protein N-acetyltransferase